MKPYKLTRLPGADSSTSGTRASYDAMALAEARRRAREATIAGERAAWARLAAELEAMGRFSRIDRKPDSS